MTRFSFIQYMDGTKPEALTAEQVAAAAELAERGYRIELDHLQGHGDYLDARLKYEVGPGMMIGRGEITFGIQRNGSLFGGVRRGLSTFELPNVSTTAAAEILEAAFAAADRVIADRLAQLEPDQPVPTTV